MTVIAMTREMGTLGKDVAAGVAEALKLEVVHHELVEQHVAERLQTSESAVHRFLEGEASLWERWKIDSRRLSRLTSEEILERALAGNVIIRGWGAAQLLRAIPQVICVRVCAPMKNRMAEMVRRLGISDDAVARREIQRSDAAHARVAESRFSRDWMDPTGYDLVINTAYVPIETGVSLICQHAQAVGREGVSEMTARLKDKLIEERIRSMLEEAPNIKTVGGNLDVTAVDGNVTLVGFVESASGLADLTEKIKRLDGVGAVSTEVRDLPWAYYGG
jgi:cytidylate kinase